MKLKERAITSAKRSKLRRQELDFARKSDKSEWKLALRKMNAARKCARRK